MQARKGFTLIELSIVLVIIGLIVGGILVGNEMVMNATRNKQMADLEKISTAVNAFRIKYNCLPADCSNARQFFTGSSQPTQVTNGNGNGKIDRGNPLNGYTFSWAWGDLEWTGVFDQLTAAGLSDFPQYDETSANRATNNRAGVGYPNCILKADGTFMSPGETDTCGLIISYEFIGHFFRFGAQSDSTGNNTQFFAGHMPATALIIDTKFDDGVPLSGAIQAAAIGYQSGMDAWPSAPFYNKDLTTESAYGVGGNFPCTNVGLTAYNTATSNRVCSLRVKASF